MAWLGRSCHVCVGPPAGNDKAAVGRADGPGQPHTVDEHLTNPADHGAGVSATIDSTTSPQRQPPSQLEPSGTGRTPVSPNAASTWSGGRSTVTTSA
jgi:hypothetical protein